MSKSVASASSPESDQRESARWLRAACEVGLILAVFAWHAPWAVPDVNEAHYLGKARHYWDPGWAAGDYFLETADSHLAFQFTLGWISRFVSLPTFAWISRLVCWSLLACTFRLLARQLLARSWLIVLAAALWISLWDQSQMAGEWVIGGAEAKVLAFGLVFGGLAAAVAGRWNLAWVLLGGAAAFHVLVGGWSVIAAGVAWLRDPDRPAFRQMLPGLATGGLVSLAGVIPGLALSYGVDPQVAQQAYHIYVYDRLSHHLYFPWFRTTFIARQVLIISLWTLAAWQLGRAARHEGLAWGAERRLNGFVCGAILIAMVGVVLSLVDDWQAYMTEEHPPWAAGLLRLYWFRLSDVMVPLGASLTICQILAARPQVPKLWQRAASVAAVVSLGWYLGWHLEEKLAEPLPPAYRVTSSASFNDWLDVCRWGGEETAPDARFIPPRYAATFRWYAERPEVVNWKDVPQDAGGLVAWWERLGDVSDALGLDPRFGNRRAWPVEENLVAVARKYGATYLIAPAAPRWELPVAHENASFIVYRVGP